MEVRPGYKLTEAGVIPETWQVFPLAALAHIKTGKRNNEDKIEDGEYPFFVRSDVVERINSYSYEGEAILVPGEGRIGDIFHYTNGRFDVHQRVYAITRFQADCNAQFLHRYMALRFGAWAMQNTVKATVDSLRLPTFQRFLVPLPPLGEQRAIAAALSDVDALLGGLDRLIAKKRDLKQAAMQQLLTGQTRLPGFSGEWTLMKFAELLEYERPDQYIVGSTKYDTEGHVPVLTANKSFVLGHTNERFGVFDNLPAVIFDDFTTDSKYVEFPFKVKSSAIKILKARDTDANLKFVAERMRLLKFPVGEHKRYYISEYQHVELPTPEPAEQSALAAVLSDMDAELAALEVRRDKTRDLKQAMMQELLTGRTRLVKPKRAHA